VRASGASTEVLSARRLGRSTLARQLLLEPARLGVVEAVERIAGLQAQEPASPYIGLWARLADFDPAQLDRAIGDRRLVKATLMRATLHLVSARDYRALWPAIVPMLENQRRHDRLEPPPRATFDAIRADLADYAAEPRSLAELREHLGEVDGMPADVILWWLRRRHPLAHAPSAGPWSFGRRPLLADADAWLGAGQWLDPTSSIEHVVRRYLGAFGPASIADLARWTGLAVRLVRPGVDAVDQARDLRRLRSERGRELLDLIDAPLPEEDVSAPPRLLPMWDSTVLAYDDRTRIVSDADRARIVARNGDTLPIILVDGVVAGRWWAVADGGTTRIELEPFRRLTASDRIALEELGDRLARFVEPHEPAVYARYQRWRRDDA
jgi:hypothetical protein